MAGPGGGPLDGWAELLAPSLVRSLSPGQPLRKALVGGQDGVTGANQLDARTVPDGSTAALLPGAAALAWLVGDPRARFDAANWVPALAATTPGLVVSRISAGQALGGAKLRVAAAGPAGAELPAMLAMDLLGMDWQPTFGLPETDALSALQNGQVDAVCLGGRRVAELAGLLGSTGARPMFSLGVLDEAGQRRRDPAFSDTPDATELMAGRVLPADLLQAWLATAAASELEVSVVLPHLTPAAMVALWRRACAQAVESGAVRAEAQAVGVRPMPVPAATASTAAVLADAAAQVELRRWLAGRLNYRAA